MTSNNNKALVVFSGGQDSTTCLHWAINKYESVEAIFFDYGQRHLIELESAKRIAELNEIPLKVLKVDTLKQLGGNSLTDDIEIDTQEGELPNTFVPGRNLIFLTYAAAFAYQKGISHLVTGVCETDYSGYPDCRLSTMKSLEKTLNLGMESNFKIHTPLMDLDKKETVLLAIKEKAIQSLTWSHTCYEGQYPPCKKCPSCILRAKGFSEAGIIDPIFQRNC
jgi:7-cyano-7-deazaguanine synthase